METKEELLNRAKQTLNELTFFALHEFQNYSKILFEKSFGNGDMFKFKTVNVDSLVIDDLKTMDVDQRYGLDEFNQSVIDKIKEINSLDVELYEYAVQLFFKKLEYFKII